MKDDRLKGSIFEDGISNIEIRKRILEKVGGKTRKEIEKKHAEKKEKEGKREKREEKKKDRQIIRTEYLSHITFTDRKLMEKVRAKTGRDLHGTYMLVMRYKLGELTEEDLYKPYNKRGRKPNEFQQSSP